MVKMENIENTIAVNESPIVDMSRVLGLFSVPVGIYNLDRPITKQEKDFILGLDTRPNMGNTTSVDHFLCDNKKMAKLKKFFLESVNHYFQTVDQPKYNVSLRLTQVWANYSEKGQWHHEHSHPNSIVSGVFYFQSTPLDKIYFINPNLNTQLQVATDNYNMFNSSSWWLNTDQNTLLLFPSTLKHRVDPVETETTRISISFNTFYVGEVGERNSLTGLTL